VALGARVVLTGVGGSRELTLEEFLVGPYETELGEDELIEAVIVPLGAPAAAYRKFQVLERPAVGVAAVGTVREGVFDGAPVVVAGAVDERPVRIPADFDGMAVEDALDALAEAAAEAVDPVDDLSGSEEYKRHLTGVLAKRAVLALGEA
jgi:carbon-monoxide dehydrogenase medium subunit